MATKILVAVHGIGDQFNYATIQSVAYQLLAYFDNRMPVPLGTFHQVGDGTGPRILVSPPFTGPPGIGFAEVYWADIPRKIVTEGYTLEESKKWAKTIVGRVRARLPGMGVRDQELTETVLEELIDTVAVAERLCFIAEKAGVFTLNLQRVLMDFLDDVQVVTEFPSYRGKILEQFDTVMTAVAAQDGGAEIYLVSHSEGTVVMLAGLLHALRSAPAPPWVDHVRGVMTIGSPLDTHVLLWPDLWAAGKPPTPGPPRHIPWLNYYDVGDPIADSLQSTDQWLRANHCDGVFDITNVRFSRYFFPGKAHVDYWTDKDVFGHFIQEVVKPPDVAGGSRRHFAPPQTKRLPQITSYVAPYALIAALFFVAMFVLYRSLTAAMDVDPSSLDMVRDVALLGFLLAGITVAARLFRLTEMWRWRVVGLLVFGASALVYAVPLIFDVTINRDVHDVVGNALGFLGLPEWAALVAAAAIVVAGAILGRRSATRWGMRVMLIAGAIVILGLVGIIVALDRDRGPVWPILLGSVAFLYLWWLAALLFDLVFVWHRYVRHSVALNNLRAPGAWKTSRTSD